MFVGGREEREVGVSGDTSWGHGSVYLQRRESAEAQEGAVVVLKNYYRELLTTTTAPSQIFLGMGVAWLSATLCHPFLPTLPPYRTHPSCGSDYYAKLVCKY